MNGFPALLQWFAFLLLIVGIGNILPIADNSEPVVGVILVIAAVILWGTGRKMHIQRIEATLKKAQRGEQLDDDDRERLGFIRREPEPFLLTYLSVTTQWIKFPVRDAQIVWSQLTFAAVAGAALAAAAPGKLAQIFAQSQASELYERLRAEHLSLDDAMGFDQWVQSQLAEIMRPHASY